MSDRRQFLLSAAGAVAAAGLAAPASAGPFAQSKNTGMPKGTIIPGKPPDQPAILDFGNSLKIPLDKTALKTLWEGPDMWLTFGAGNAHYATLAIRDAARSAEGMMTLMLLTLAFAPDRLAQVNGCGWQVKSGNMHDVVLGDVDLPGQPFMPITTTYSNGATSTMDTGGSTGSASGVDTTEPSSATSTGQDFNDPAGSFTYVHAFTGFIVLKKDASLDYVRSHGQVVSSAN